ncbi:MAG: DUF2298 domain-containing protein [Microgenomates group bacterium]
MLADFGYIFIWWLVIFAFGLIFFPLTRKIFSNFFDQGYLFSKVIGLAVSSYLVWFLASLKILPFYKETIWLVLILGLIFNLIILRKKTLSAVSRPTITNRQSLITFLFEELMFFITLAFWSYIRGFQPDIQGLEKFMDFGFVNSILRTKYFPPADMWFAGKPINYYYFGHYVTAFLTKLTGIDSAITYNLMMATLFAFTFSLTFSLTGNLIYLWEKFSSKVPVPNYKLLITNYSSIITAGLISALLISLGANLHPAYYNFKMEILKKPYCDGSFSYWYPNATRYIGYCPDVDDKTIHEFPAYSFVVSDLHGHVSDIPFVLLFLALSLTLFIKIKENKNLSFFQLLTSHFSLPLLLAVFYMTNQWDYPIYLMVLGLVLLWGFSRHYRYMGKTLIKAAAAGIVIVLLSIPFFLPFQLGFEPIAKGVGFVRAHSLFYQLLILWGVPWFFELAFLLFLFSHHLRPRQLLKKGNLAKWFFKTLDIEGQSKKITAPTSKSSFSLPTSHFPPDLFVLILLLVSTILVIIPEIIYVKDIYITSYHRANTMFKLTYQSFVMFSISIGYIIIRILSSLRKGLFKKTFFLLSFTLFALLMVYPLYSIQGYYGKLSTKNYKGIYGLNFIRRLYPDDYQAILWLNKNVSGQPNILEAVGDSYTDYERISMATGLPTIEGWLVHEWLWRGSFDEPGKRSGEVQTIYETKNSTKAKQLLDKYKVKYVVVGGMEREKYPNLDEEKFKSLGKEVFRSGTTTIYKLIQ